MENRSDRIYFNIEGIDLAMGEVRRVMEGTIEGVPVISIAMDLATALTNLKSEMQKSRDVELSAFEKMVIRKQAVDEYKRTIRRRKAKK